MKRSITQAKEQNHNINNGAMKVFSVDYSAASAKKHKSYKFDGTLELLGMNAVLKDSQGRVSCDSCL